jgi:UDP-glucuronate decarboxylase
MIRGFRALMATDDDVTGPVNLGNPHEFSMRELADLVLELTGSSSKIVHLPAPQDDPKQRQPDIRRAREVLDWAPTVPLREGLVETIRYFDDLLSRTATRADA